MAAIERKKKRPSSAKERLSMSLGLSKKEAAKEEEEKFGAVIQAAAWYEQEDDSDDREGEEMAVASLVAKGTAGGRQGSGGDSPADGLSPRTDSDIAEAETITPRRRKHKKKHKKKHRKSSKADLAEDCPSPERRRPASAASSNDGDGEDDHIGARTGRTSAPNSPRASRSPAASPRAQPARTSSGRVKRRKRRASEVASGGSDNVDQRTNVSSGLAAAEPQLRESPRKAKVTSPRLASKDVRLSPRKLSKSKRRKRKRKKRVARKAAVDDQPVEFTDERRRRMPPSLRKSASLSTLMDSEEMAALRGMADARGLFASRAREKTTRGVAEPTVEKKEEPSEDSDEDEFDKPQAEHTVLRSKNRKGWRSLLKKSQFSLDIGKKGWRPGVLSRKAKSQSELGSKGKLKQRGLCKSEPTKSYRDVADINSIDSLNLMLAGDERLPSFKKFLDDTYSTENYGFYDAVTKFRKQTNDEERRLLAVKAMRTYIGSKAPFELNLDTRVVRELEAKWEEIGGDTEGRVVPVDFFDTPYEAIYSLLYYDLYMRYIVSETFTDFEAGLAR